MKVKMLKAEKRYGLKKGDELEVELLKQEPRYAIFLEPPIRRLNLYNEDWIEVKPAPCPRCGGDGYDPEHQGVCGECGS